MFPIRLSSSLSQVAKTTILNSKFVCLPPTVTYEPFNSHIFDSIFHLTYQIPHIAYKSHLRNHLSTDYHNVLSRKSGPLSGRKEWKKNISNLEQIGKSFHLLQTRNQASFIHAPYFNRQYTLLRTEKNKKTISTLTPSLFKQPHMYSLCYLLRKLVRRRWSPLNLPFCMLDKHIIFSLSSQDISSSHATSLGGLLQAHSGILTSIVNCWTKNCIQYSK